MVSISPKHNVIFLTKEEVSRENECILHNGVPFWNSPAHTEGVLGYYENNLILSIAF